MATKSGHVFVNTYRAPLGAGIVISTDRPGEKIAKAITEIQSVIENMEGTDGEGGTMVTKPVDEEIAAATTVETTLITGVQFANNQMQIKTQKITITTMGLFVTVTLGIESGWGVMGGGQVSVCDDT